MDFAGLLLILAPILAYFYISLRYAPTMLFADDFDLIEAVAFGPDVETLGEKIFLWYKQQNEHRIIFPRLITYLSSKFDGYIKWETVAFLANLIWVASVYFLWKVFQTFRLPVWLFATIPLLLFQPQYYENIYWPISILQQSDVIFWHCFAVYLYSTGRFKWAMLPALGAIFTHGSGLTILPTIGLLIVIEKRWDRLKIWVPFCLLVAAIYFHNYHGGQSSGVGESLSDPVRLILSFFAFFGGLTRVVFKNPYLASLAGFAMFSLLAVSTLPPALATFRSKNKKLSVADAFLLGTFVILSLTSAMVAVSRSWGGIDAILPSRYLHNTVFFASLAYLALLKHLSGRVLKLAGGAILICAIGFNIVSYIVFLPAMYNHQARLYAEETNYLNLGKFPKYNWSFDRNIKERYQRAVAKGALRMQKRLPDISGEYPVDSSIQFTFSHHISSPLDIRKGESASIIWVEGRNTSKEPVYLYLQPTEGPGYWLLLEKSRPAYKALFTKLKWVGDRLHGYLPFENLPEGEYKVGTLQDNNFRWTGQTIVVDHNQNTLRF